MVEWRDDIHEHSEMREEALQLRSQLKAALLQHAEQIWLNDCLIFIQRNRSRMREGGDERARQM